MKTWSDYKITEISIGDKGYPSGLLEIKNPPKKIYVRGKLNKELFEKSIAVVGSRRATQYGKAVTEKFVGDLVASNTTIISGFMYGIDTYAHKMTVEYGGKTVAVLGCGLDVCYPVENEILYTKILESGGVVISEYEPKAKPHLWKFPQRNRIVVGLSTLGVLVVEAGEASGSLVTAEIAIKSGKEVFAVPGPITSTTSAGTNNLIKDKKAKMILGIGDVIKEKIVKEKSKSNNSLDGLEREIYNLLLSEPLSTDEVVRALKKDVVEVGTALSIMSMKGLITELAGKFYVK